MPWHIESDNAECEGFAVIKDSDNSVVGCHDTEEEAEVQLAALNIAESEENSTTSTERDTDRDSSTKQPSNNADLLKLTKVRQVNAPKKAKLMRILSERGIEIEDPFFFEAEISNNQLDSYFTRMHESSLRNYAKDAASGVSFLDSHDHWKLGIGRSLDGKFIQNDDNQRVFADFYTVRGLNFGGQHSYASTDDFITAVESGIVKDVSIGFHNDRTICDICHDEVWSWTSRCPHFPGVKYEIDGEMIRATATVKDANLNEVSAVFDGATPEAAIRQKAERLHNEGKLDLKSKIYLENRFNIRIKGEQIMPDKPDVTLESILANARSEISDLPQTPEKAVQWLIEQIRSQQATIEDQTNEVNDLKLRIETLEPDAKEGQAYRKDLIDAALTEGVRAYGDQFDQDTYRGVLEVSPLEVIKTMTADWKAVSEKRFPGGKQTTETPADPEYVDLTPPAAAFRV